MREVKNSTTTSKKYFEVPSDLITSQYTIIYPPEIPTQPTLDLSYTSSTDTAHQYQDSSLNEELRGVTLKEPLYHIPNTEVD